MTAADYLMLISMVCIWALMAINVFLSVGGFLYYHQCSKTDGHVPIDEYPFVSIMVPAHNESVVIRRTVRALLNFDYPHDRYEIIVINDNSTDDTANVLKQIQAANPSRNLIVVNTDNVVGGKGKSNALNIGYSVAKGSVFAIYDADNTPEPQALRILVENLMSDSSLGAVIALALGVTVPGSEYGGTMLMAMAFAFLSLVLILSLAYALDHSLATNSIILIGVIFSMFKKAPPVPVYPASFASSFSAVLMVSYRLFM